MVGLSELWLPILVSGIAVFFVSSLVHMVLPLHRSDYGRLEGEAGILASMREGGVGPGHYMFPHCNSMQEYGTPEHIAKLKEGPVGFITVMPPGPVRMGRQLGIWFAYILLVSAVGAYLIGLSTPAGAESKEVFRRFATFSLAVYGIGAMPESIWKGLRWGITVKFIFDGLLYALATGAVFATMWPAAG
ncbi:MAG: hypothetical protein ACYTGJ_04075 [Planctomycetota bacterium]|jgi:hypothetical protein